MAGGPRSQVVPSHHRSVEPGEERPQQCWNSGSQAGLYRRGECHQMPRNGRRPAQSPAIVGVRPRRVERVIWLPPNHGADGLVRHQSKPPGSATVDYAKRYPANADSRVCVSGRLRDRSPKILRLHEIVDSASLLKELWMTPRLKTSTGAFRQRRPRKIQRPEGRPSTAGRCRS